MRAPQAAAEVAKVSLKLEEYKRQARELQTHEGLLGREVIEYPELQATARKFEKSVPPRLLSCAAIVASRVLFEAVSISSQTIAVGTA